MPTKQNKPSEPPVLPEPLHFAQNTYLPEEQEDCPMDGVPENAVVLCTKNGVPAYWFKGWMYVLDKFCEEIPAPYKWVEHPLVTQEGS